MHGFLFTADMHLRDTIPTCRTDNFLKAQWNKIHAIQKICIEKRLYWIDAGDIFHKAQPPIKLINEVLFQMWRTPIKGAIYGNHDLPAHNLSRASESAWDILFNADVIETILCDEPMMAFPGVHVYGASYGESIPTPERMSHIINVLVMHKMVYKSKNDKIPNAPGDLARTILKKNPEYQLIISGHNHKSFESEYEGRKLVNIGCLTRQTADMADHKPMALIWIPSKGFSYLQLPFKEKVITRDHIDKKEKKEEELNAFVESLQSIEDVSLSFEDNVNRVIAEAKPEQPVIEKVREAIG